LDCTAKGLEGLAGKSIEEFVVKGTEARSEGRTEERTEEGIEEHTEESP
jgi:hypothetical protein